MVRGIFTKNWKLILISIVAICYHQYLKRKTLSHTQFEFRFNVLTLKINFRCSKRKQNKRRKSVSNFITKTQQ